MFDFSTLTEKQAKGLKIATDRFNAGESHTTIAGYAGSGKTYLVRAIIEKLGLHPHEYAMATFVGKAALRLQQTGFPQATTLHKFLYESKPIFAKGTREIISFHHQPYPLSHFKESGLKLVIVDEVSMVPDKILHQLAATGLQVIMLGDPGQLPPIGADNGMLDRPHIFLDEIQRQAEGNSIIKLSKMIREGEKIKPFSDENVRIITPDELDPSMYDWADQIICGKNVTRTGINNTVRTRRGFTKAHPEIGDKVIITKNSWDFLNADGYPLVNGLIGTATRSFVNDDPRAQLLGQKSIIGLLDLDADFSSSPFIGIKYDARKFIEGKESFNMDINTKDPYKKINEIDFGYAITAHKSQGSEYDNVLAIEEVLSGKNHRRWLYTTVTRASEKLVLVANPSSSVWDLD